MTMKSIGGKHSQSVKIDLAAPYIKHAQALSYIEGFETIQMNNFFMFSHNKVITNDYTISIAL